jgi:hypothetical protein
MKQIIVLLGLVASASVGLAWGGEIGPVGAAGSPSWNRAGQEGQIVAQTGYEGRNEDGESETVDTSSS